jgi:ribosomal protein S6--L-glutamate ligase
MSEKKFLILGIRNYANRRILHELQKQGHTARIMNPELLLPFINDKKNDRIYIQQPGKEKAERLYKKSISGIVPRIGGALQFFSKHVEHIHRNIGIPSTASATGLLNAQDKIRTAQLLSQHGIKTPKTFAARKIHNMNHAVEMLGGFPVVGKLIYGSQGDGVFILTEPVSAATVLDAFSSQGHNFLLQQFIETAKDEGTKHDFRYVVVGGKVVARMKRNSVGKDFRTNASIKEDCEKAKPDAEMDEIAIKAAAAVGLDCAGVDLARDINTKEVYCYEVNGNFNFKSTERFTRENVGKAIADYMVHLSEGVNSTFSAFASSNEQIEIPSGEPGFDISKMIVDPGLPLGSPYDDIDDEDEKEFSFYMRPGQYDNENSIKTFVKILQSNDLGMLARDNFYAEAARGRKMPGSEYLDKK